MDELERIRKEKLKELMEKQKNKTDVKLDKPIEVTDATFKDVINKYNLVVVDCWAPWCGPCRIIGPVVEELAREYAGKVTFGKLNVDNNRMVSAEYGIMSIPTLLVFKGGELVDRIIGALPKQMLEHRLSRYLTE